MASSSKKWAKIVSRTASLLFFALIIFQVPLFRFPCSIGTCTNPVEIAASQLISSESLPAVIPNALLYPGAFAKSLIHGEPSPSYNKLLDAPEYANLKDSPAAVDLQQIEVLAGSFLAVAGAVLGLVISWRTSLLGLLLILWGIGKEVIFGPYVTEDSSQVAVMYSTMSVAMLSAFLSVRGDVRKLLRAFNLEYFFYPLVNRSRPKYH